MTSSYPAPVAPVNASAIKVPEKNPVELPSRVASFYRWLHRWHAETEDLHAATPYFAKKQRVSERTVYRWLACLRALGYIQTEQTPGIERRITPQLEPPPKRRQKRTTSYKRSTLLSGVMSGVMSGVPTLEASDALDATTTGCVNAVPAPPAPEVSVDAVSAGADVVKCLRGAGLPQPAAVGLVDRHGLKAVRSALAAYQAAKHVRNPAGWLVKAVERGYQFTPGGASEGRTGAKKHTFNLPCPAPVEGLTGKAAFDALRSRLATAGRASAQR